MKTMTRNLAHTVAALAVAVSPFVFTVSAHAEEVTLVISNNQWLDSVRGERLWAAIKKYESVNPNVTLEQEAVPAQEYADRLMTEMGAGQGPDLAIVQEDLFYTLAGADFLVSLDDIAGSQNLNVTNANAVVDGAALGLGWQRAVYALIYNKALLERSGASLPTTTEEMIEQASAISNETGAIGFTSRHSMNEFRGWSYDFQNWVFGFGVEWVDAEGNLTINTPQAVAALNAFKLAYDSGVIPIGDPMNTQRSRFKEGRVAFSIDNSGGALNIASGGAMPSSDMGAAPMFFEHPGAHQQIFITLSSHSDHPEEAKAFLSWFISPEGQNAMREVSGPDALATDVPVTAEYEAVNPWAPMFAELARTSRSTLIPGYEAETTSIMRFVMEAVERMLIAGESAEDVLAAAQIEIDAKFE